MFLSERIIIPTSKKSYIARATDEKTNSNYKAIKVGNVHIFNSKILSEEGNEPIFVAEGEIDALSIIEVGSKAIGLGGTSNICLLEREINKKRPLILCLDNDEAGKKASKKIEENLKKKGIPFINVSNTIPSGIKDPNEMLMKDKEALKIAVENSKLQLKETLEEKKVMLEKEIDEMSCLPLTKHLRDMENNAKISSIDTGFEGFNNVLGGGLKGGRLYAIGAISSLGKTTFVLQVLDNVAKSGNPVLFFSLEMSKTELISKSLSRESFKFCKEEKKDYKLSKTASEIFGSCTKLNEAQGEVFLNAVKEYTKYAGNIYINEGIENIGVKQIRETLVKFVSCKKVNPMVVVDYMQMLSPYDKYFSDKQNMDKNVLELKRISRDYKVPVIAISSFNRESYLNEVSFESFKESGGIEYSVDVLIGLQLKVDLTDPSRANEKDKKRREINEAKNKYPREIQLVILKNRMYKAWSRVDFNYYPANEFFECLGVVDEK
jgi:replicative DNA helicase